LNVWEISIVARKLIRLRILLGAIWVVCMLLDSGCDMLIGISTQQSKIPPSTPTVDVSHAHEAFQSGGELTYDEVIVLKRAIVGDFDDVRKIKDDTEYNKAEDAFRAREDAFAVMLEKCTLKEMYGWVAGSQKEYDRNYKLIPDENRLAIYLYNLMYGADPELIGHPEMYLVYLSDKEAATLKVGQRIKFSGALFMLDGHEAVKNATYALEDDDPPVPTPTADELKDLHVTLSRGMCVLGRCPAYTLTIGPDDQVIFDGKYNTAITGTVKSNMGQGKFLELAEEIKKADFFTLADDYPANVTEQPQYKLSIQMGGMSKEVVSKASGPRRLKILMDRVDQIVNSAQWIDGGK
jgi:hypothetical protein